RRRGWGLDLIVDRQDALLGQLALWTVRCFGCILWNGAGLLGEGQIGIAGLVGCLHSSVTRQGGRDSKFLLGPVNVRKPITWRRLDQTAQPHAGPEDIFRIARLIAPGARPER